MEGWPIEGGKVKSPTFCMFSPEALYFRRGPPFVPEAVLSCSWMCFSEHRKPRTKTDLLSKWAEMGACAYVCACVKLANVFVEEKRFEVKTPQL